MMKIQGQCAPALGDLGRGGGGHGGGGRGGWHGGGRTSVARVFVGGSGWGWGGWGYPYWYGYYPYAYAYRPVCASPCRPLNIGGYGCYTTDGTLATCVPPVSAYVPGTGTPPPGGYAI